MLKFSLWSGKKKAKPQTSDTNTASSHSSIHHLSQGLANTRKKWSEGLSRLFLGKKTLDADLLKEIETYLLTADIGITTTQAIIKDLTQALTRGQLKDSQQVLDQLRTHLERILQPVEQPLTLPHDTTSPYVILVVGVNGTGKTTTIGKLAARFQAQGADVLLGAGDTFRAAAVQQLQVWGQNHNIPVVAQKTGADSASVSFEALQSGQSRNMDVVMLDTAGRLHNKDNLMQELQKIKRVLAKLDSNAPHETLLVLDATTGQNGLRQAQAFQEAVDITGIVLTKLDGTAKGGMIFSIAQTLKLPIRFVGVGEGAEHLQPFNAKDFVNALFYDK